MPDTAPKSFVGRIREILNDLSPSERRLAEFALDFPGDLAGYTASELASLAHVSNATVTRFIRRLGYTNYEAARKQVRSEKNAGSPCCWPPPRPRRAARWPTTCSKARAIWPPPIAASPNPCSMRSPMPS
ncbi:MurR/RpiR family transcriptional regulator [Alcaligenes sp. Marseille-Q7550]